MQEIIKIKFSAVIPTFNDAKLLKQCLQSLDFCDELIVVDQGSTDRSLDISKEFRARILMHELKPYPNEARQYGIEQAQNEWVISIDPDEVFPKEDIHKIKKIVAEKSDLDGIRLPWQFYFLGKELNYSIWGRQSASKCAVVNRDRIKGTPYVHLEFSNEQNIHHFPKGSINPIQHYWINSLQELFVKLQRYAKCEGESKFSAGQRFSYPRLMKYSIASFYTNLTKYRGLANGLNGIFLSSVYSWYVFLSWLSLRRYERENGA